MKPVLLEEPQRSYAQSQRILRVYSDFSCEETDRRTEYRCAEHSEDWLETYHFRSCFLYPTLCQNVSNLCRIIRLFATGETRIVRNPFSYHGFQLLEMCRKGSKLNCAGCSIVLNDILIALGYRSKCVCCIPYDTEDDDTHVVVHVLDEANRRWFVADPAMGRVPCRPTGEAMDLLALREYLSEEAELPFYRSGKLLQSGAECRKYAEELVGKVFLFLTFADSGSAYDFHASNLIVPEGITHISRRYDTSARTSNAFSLYN